MLWTALGLDGAGQLLYRMADDVAAGGMLFYYLLSGQL